jgi:succinate-semialdehyde dehydrogenase/glutarate-semialdehyde dehydrogenase
MTVVTQTQKTGPAANRNTSVNPAYGELLATFAHHTDEELATRIEQAAKAFSTWRETCVQRRCELLARVAILLRQDAEKLAKLATSEMGKPITQATAEVEKCAWVCDYYAEHAADFLMPREVDTDAAESFVRFDPLGPVLAIMPWNFPYWQVFRFAAPALAAGNVGLLKHARNVTGVALAIEELFLDAGFPPGVFSTLVISNAQAEQVIAHPHVMAVTLTGSEGAGRAVAVQAGKAIKKCVLELGGSDPLIVLDDADIELAAEQAVAARTQNSGQSCIAAKRFIVCESIAEAFVEAFVERMKDLNVGEPMDEATDVGPLARRDLVNTLHEQVISSIDDGARLLCGGKPVDPYGCYYAPTVLDCVTPGMAVFDEETFGPVAAIVRAMDVEHAIQLANQTCFGLGASLWTTDLDRAKRLAVSLDAGCVSINEIVKSDPRLPFGGVKASGYGRELADFGIREFVNIKSVTVAQFYADLSPSREVRSST